MLQIKHDEDHYLPFSERDRSLLRGDWPNMAGLGSSWKKSRKLRCPQREIECLPPPEAKFKEREPAVLKESILRFPSAPVFATHEARQHAYKVNERWPNYHTMRVLTRSDRSETQARHVFLLHNGLNETRDISFHYRLANWILAERKNAACIIRPLPAHLNRYFFQSPFAELPLDEYLQDPASVFRQFLRYMLETQWLLSVLVPRSNYEVDTGCELLLYGRQRSRSNAAALATEIMTQANRTLKTSKQRSDKTGQSDTGYSRQLLHHKDVLDCVSTLRQLLGWSPADSAKPPTPEPIDRPAIHAVGYSMGGFIAQSVFFAWPFAVSSCSNLFAGGALRDLAPTAFAHTEEWQSVLHGLRSELDHARITQYLSPVELTQNSDEQFVVGISKRAFEYFERVFEDVFLQSDRGSYSTRLAEFSRRLFFVLGGDDPIVQTRNVLDAAPPGGITLHQIGDVSHFQDSKHKEPVEVEQRDFWLPEVGGMIGRFAERGAHLLQQTNSKCWGGIERPIRPTKDAGRNRRQSKRTPDGSLANMQFERELDSMLDVIDQNGGWLFIARNQIPTVFLEEDAFRAHAAAMHHSEDLIGDYVDGLRARADRLAKLDGGFSLLIPSAQVLSDGGDETAFKHPDTARDRAMFSKSEVAIRYWPEERSRRNAWDHFAKKWCLQTAVREVRANEYLPAELGGLGKKWDGEHPDEAEKIAVTMLPDVWIAFDNKACDTLLETDLEEYKDDPGRLRSDIERGMIDLATKLTPKKGKRVTDKKLHDLLATGSARIIKVSAAELNSRFRGRLLDDSSRETGGVASLLIHWAMAYEASVPVEPA
ncbi:MAG: hypothetical protein QOF13_375 [Solirubrobacterales bacterium]|jgi:pimeloyl-ACP methyl ester carboxylesterase|nr:hypothetical protein [Solirubrobacterales bacterium]